MVLYGYSIEDNIDDNQLDIYRFRLDGSGLQRVGGIRATQTAQDLEALGTRGNGVDAVVDAISEGSFGASGDFLLSSIDAGSPLPDRVILPNNRFGNRSGADYSQDGVLYNIQGNRDRGNNPIGSVLYQISGNDVEAQGPRLDEYADGFAIANSNSVGWGSDFVTQDGDPNEIYRFDLNTGRITLTSRLVRPDGSNLNVNFDSGLAFTPDGQQLYALTENGRIYRITDFANDDGRPGNADNTAIASLVGGFRISSLPTGDRGEFEGFAIIDEPTTLSTSAPDITGTGATIAGVADASMVTEEDNEPVNLPVVEAKALLSTAEPSQTNVEQEVLAAFVPSDSFGV